MVLLMFEELSWSKNKEVELFVHASDISLRGFKLLYHIGGPSLVTRMRVKWVAVLDQQVEIQYQEWGFNELIRLRQGLSKC
jgi:hypothetical protein